MTCRACFAAWGEMPDQACTNHTDATIELAIAMVHASLVGSGMPTGEALAEHSEIERAGWFMEDAAAALNEIAITSPFTVRFKHGRRWTNIYVNDFWFKFDHNAEGFDAMHFVGAKRPLTPGTPDAQEGTL